MELTDQIIVYLYSYFPALMLGGFFWWLDRFERESLFLVMGVFFWGAFGAGLLSYFWNTFFYELIDMYQTNNTANDIIVSVTVAPLIEEFTKGCLILVLLKLNKVDDITDGILMGVLIGLGFAASENVDYALNIFRSSGELAMWYNLWFREIHTTLLHASATAVWGAFIGYSRYHKGGRRLAVILNGFLLAMLTHAFWNFMANFVHSIQAGVNIIDVVMRLELVAIFGLLLAMFLFSLFGQSQIIIRELTEEHENRVIPWEHIGFFASLMRDPRRYAFPPKVNPPVYAKLGVRLAFRKHEYRINPGPTLAAEIDGLRRQLSVASGYEMGGLSLHYGRQKD